MTIIKDRNSQNDQSLLIIIPRNRLGDRIIIIETKDKMTQSKDN